MFLFLLLFLIWICYEAIRKRRKCRLLLIFQNLEQSKLLGSQATEDEGSGGDGGDRSGGRGQHQTSSGGEGGSRNGVQEHDWLGHGHADQADGEGDSEKAHNLHS